MNVRSATLSAEKDGVVQGLEYGVDSDGQRRTVNEAAID